MDILRATKQIYKTYKSHIICSQDHLDPVFIKGQDVSLLNPFIELAPVLYAIPQIKSCMITAYPHLLTYSLEKLTRQL